MVVQILAGSKRIFSSLYCPWSPPRIHFNGDSFLGVKATGAWCWPLTSI